MANNRSFATLKDDVFVNVLHSKKACHPELVEGARAEAFAHMLRQAQQDSPF